MKISADVVQSVFENNKTLAVCHLSSEAVLFGVCTLVSSVIQSCGIESNHLAWRTFGYRGARCLPSPAQLELEKIGASRFRWTPNAANGSALRRTREESHLAKLTFGGNPHPCIPHLGTTKLANAQSGNCLLEWEKFWNVILNVPQLQTLHVHVAKAFQFFLHQLSSHSAHIGIRVQLVAVGQQYQKKRTFEELVHGEFGVSRILRDSSLGLTQWLQQNPARIPGGFVNFIPPNLEKFFHLVTLFSLVQHPMMVLMDDVPAEMVLQS